MLQLSLPDDFKASYRIHDGSGREQLTPDEWSDRCYHLLSLEEIKQKWQFMQNSAKDTEQVIADDGIRAHWWHLSWIPFMYNFSCDLLCIDMAPTASGTPGQVIEYLHDSVHREKIADSFAEFLDQLHCCWSEIDRSVD